MTNEELQIAIDKTREFIGNTGTAAGPLWEARTKSKDHLKKLEELQATRASMVTQDEIKAGCND